MKALIRYITSRACRSRFLSRVIFGMDFQPLEAEDYYFDVTTPVLVKKAAKILNRNSRLLDMGTGASCVVGLSLWRKLGCQVTASDVDSEIIALAEKNIRRNGAPIEVINSRFFDDINKTFDFVIFNPPYVPTKTGKARNLPEKRRSQWDGGADGAEIIKGFLDAFSKLNYPVTAFVGVNCRHVRREKIFDFIKTKEKISVGEVYRHPILPVEIYTLNKY